MTSDSSEAIAQARKHLQQGDIDAARAVLVGFVRAHPEAEEGWLLLAQTISDARQKADCLRQALRLNPANEQARQQLEELQAGKAVPAPPTRPDAAPAVANQPAKVYVAQSSQEPGLDFWEDDDTESPPPAAKTASAPAAKAATSQPAKSLQRPEAQPKPAPVSPQTAPAGETEPAAVVFKPATSLPPINASAPAAPAPAKGDHEATSDAKASNAIPSFAPDVPESTPEAAPGGPEKPSRPATDEKPQAKETQGKKKGKQSMLPLFLVVAVLAAIGIAIVGGIWVVSYVSTSLLLPAMPTTDGEQAVIATLLPTEEPTFALPPSWTPTPTNTLAPTSTITPTPPPSATPTLIPPPPTALAMMESIQKDVSVLRGLPILEQVPTYILPPLIAEQALRREYIDDAAITQLADEGRALSALGLIAPGYDLALFKLNSMVDNFGGYYQHSTKRIYILGWNFSAFERYYYAHEFDHALIDQNFSAAGLQSLKDCANAALFTTQDQCQAVNALIEGDTTLAMERWLAQYASPEDARRLRKYSMPEQAFKEPSPPDYVIQTLGFPYQYGKAFVQSLFDEGNWARVDQAYGQLPQSSEQIMHPEKYNLAETPISIQDTPLLLVLDAEWRPIKTSTLGEWNTFLILAYGAEKFAQQAAEDAASAASGWGGDQYQVYYKESSRQTLLAIHWIWDSEMDAQEFAVGMQAYLAARFRGNAITRPAGACWEVNAQTTCFYSQNNQSLWLLAPDQTTLDLALSLYPLFVSP